MHAKCWQEGLKRVLGILRHRLKNNIKINLEETGWEGVAEDKNR
jgi:hypothetical protein